MGTQLPKYQAPIFQPKLIQKVPEVDNGRVVFPFSIPDFIYPKGVRVLSSFEVEQKKNKANKDSPDSYYPAEANTSVQEISLTN